MLSRVKNLQTPGIMSSKQIAVVAVAVLALGAVLLVAGRGPAPAAPPPVPAPSVTVAPVEERAIVEWEEFTGRTEPVESVEVRPRVSGYIQEVGFQSGQLGEEGRGALRD